MEEGFVKRVRLKLKSSTAFPPEEMAKILVGAGYLVQRPA